VINLTPSPAVFPGIARETPIVTIVKTTVEIVTATGRHGHGGRNEFGGTTCNILDGIVGNDGGVLKRIDSRCLDECQGSSFE